MFKVRKYVKMGNNIYTKWITKTYFQKFKIEYFQSGNRRLKRASKILGIHFRRTILYNVYLNFLDHLNQF